MSNNPFKAWAICALAARMTFAAPNAAVSSSNTPGAGAIACADIPAPDVPGAKVVAITAAERHLDASGQEIFFFSHPIVAPFDSVSICDVNVTITHPGSTDEVRFEIWLPLQGWNGRFQGVGGGGWKAGYFGLYGLGSAASQGWAAGMTDGGPIADPTGAIADPTIVSEDGHVDTGRLTNFFSRGLHELAVIGKAVTASYYGVAPHHSYWTGCSQGGRQGHMLAQRYPNDYHGILANAPAVSWTTFFTSMSWANTLSRMEKHTPSRCVLGAYFNASVAACDALDGVVDGIVSDPLGCHFDAESLIGTQATCVDPKTNQTVTEIVSATDAKIIGMVHNGPVTPSGAKLGVTVPWSVDYAAMFNPAVEQGLWNPWIKYYVKKDRNYNITSLDSIEKVTETFAEAHDLATILNSDIPDLAGFRDAGGKLLTWHGTIDDYIPLNNTLNYRRKVESAMGGRELTDDFYRFSVVPGIAHCAGGAGAYPDDHLEALVRWVETGEAPVELHGNMTTPNGENATRKMCLWPLVARFDGKGDPNDAESYFCAESFEPAPACGSK